MKIKNYNEAMHFGLTTIISENFGCVEDLLKNIEIFKCYSNFYLGVFI